MIVYGVMGARSLPHRHPGPGPPFVMHRLTKSGQIPYYLVNEIFIVTVMILKVPPAKIKVASYYKCSYQSIFYK